jgi:uncharacterized protein with HEPN domain
LARDDAQLLDILKPRRLAIEFKGLADKIGVRRRPENAVCYLHQLLIVGEVKKISPEFRAAHPEAPWKLIAGTRQADHFYDGVDLDEVWRMVISDLPELIRLIEPLVPGTH